MLLFFTILLEDYWAFFIPKSPFLRLSVILFRSELQDRHSFSELDIDFQVLM